MALKNMRNGDGCEPEECLFQCYCFEVSLAVPRRRARTTIEDFVQTYLPLHGLRVPEDLFEFLDVLVFVEAIIYEMDEENEELASRGVDEPEISFEGERVLLEVLEQLGLLSVPIRLELLQGKAYWRRERQLCAAMAGGRRDGAPAFCVADAHAASEAKSFDYRLLHFVLCGVAGLDPPTQLLMRFLFFDEHLVDIGDDLHDYEEDVLKNSFNIYRAYVHLYGQEAEQMLIERITAFEERHARALAELPEEVQSAYQKRRRQASSTPGSEKWVIPQPLLDEPGYRASVAAGEQQASTRLPQRRSQRTA